jgi:hypothetical protein
MGENRNGGRRNAYDVLVRKHLEDQVIDVRIRLQ